MTTYLLDANVLIALVVVEHEHHERVSTWASGVDQLALCSVVEGALVRYLVRLGETPATATALLRAIHAMSACDVWSDSLSYADADLSHVRGHRQVTDAYLASLAATRPDSLLATLDVGPAGVVPGRTFLVPENV